MIEYKSISKKFNARTVNEMSLLDDFSLHIAKGDFVSIIDSDRWEGCDFSKGIHSGAQDRQGVSGYAEGMRW